MFACSAGDHDRHICWSVSNHPGYFSKLHVACPPRDGSNLPKTDPQHPVKVPMVESISSAICGEESQEHDEVETVSTAESMLSTSTSIISGVALLRSTTWEEASDYLLKISGFIPIDNTVDDTQHALTDQQLDDEADASSPTHDNASWMLDFDFDLFSQYSDAATVDTDDSTTIASDETSFNENAIAFDRAVGCNVCTSYGDDATDDVSECQTTVASKEPQVTPRNIPPAIKPRSKQASIEDCEVEEGVEADRPRSQNSSRMVKKHAQVRFKETNNLSQGSVQGEDNFKPNVATKHIPTVAQGAVYHTLERKSSTYKPLKRVKKIFRSSWRRRKIKRTNKDYFKECKESTEDEECSEYTEHNEPAAEHHSPDIKQPIIQPIIRPFIRPRPIVNEMVRAEPYPKDKPRPKDVDETINDNKTMEDDDTTHTAEAMFQELKDMFQHPLSASSSSAHNASCVAFNVQRTQRYCAQLNSTLNQHQSRYPNGCVQKQFDRSEARTAMKVANEVAPTFSSLCAPFVSSSEDSGYYSDMAYSDSSSSVSSYTSFKQQKVEEKPNSDASTNESEPEPSQLPTAAHINTNDRHVPTPIGVPHLSQDDRRNMPSRLHSELLLRRRRLVRDVDQQKGEMSASSVEDSDDAALQCVDNKARSAQEQSMSEHHSHLQGSPVTAPQYISRSQAAQNSVSFPHEEHTTVFPNDLTGNIHKNQRRNAINQRVHFKVTTPNPSDSIVSSELIAAAETSRRSQQQKQTKKPTLLSQFKAATRNLKRSRKRNIFSRLRSKKYASKLYDAEYDLEANVTEKQEAPAQHQTQDCVARLAPAKLHDDDCALKANIIEKQKTLAQHRNQDRVAELAPTSLQPHLESPLLQNASSHLTITRQMQKLTPEIAPSGNAYISFRDMSPGLAVTKEVNRLTFPREGNQTISTERSLHSRSSRISGKPYSKVVDDGYVSLTESTNPSSSCSNDDGWETFDIQWQQS